MLWVFFQYFEKSFQCNFLKVWIPSYHSYWHLEMILMTTLQCGYYGNHRNLAFLGFWQLLRLLKGLQLWFAQWRKKQIQLHCTEEAWLFPMVCYFSISKVYSMSYGISKLCNFDHFSRFCKNGWFCKMAKK